jgi:hypothetical protein
MYRRVLWYVFADVSVFHPEDVGGMFLRHVIIYLPISQYNIYHGTLCIGSVTS